METMQPLSLAAVTPGDIPILTRLMADAFDADLTLEGVADPHCLDCYHCADLFEKWPGGCLDAEQYKILAGEELVGGAVIWHFAEGRDVLGLLFIAPAYQHHGFGADVWRLIEERYAETVTWLVSTPGWSSKSLRFYSARCGFRQIGTQGEYVIFAKEHHPAQVR